MYWTERHVLACTGNHCNQKGAANIINRLRFELMRRRLSDRVHFNTCGTIDLCDVGPNIVVYPDNIVLSNLTEKDIPDVVSWLNGGDIPARLVLNEETAAEQQRHGFYAALLADGNSADQDRLSARLAAAELDQAWVDEQLRRGFMSKKPNDDGTDVYAMTSKAKHRYRLDS